MVFVVSTVDVDAGAVLGRSSLLIALVSGSLLSSALFSDGFEGPDDCDFELLNQANHPAS